MLHSPPFATAFRPGSTRSLRRLRRDRFLRCSADAEVESGYVEPPDTRTLELRAVHATPENFAPFGTVSLPSLLGQSV